MSNAKSISLLFFTIVLFVGCKQDEIVDSSLREKKKILSKVVSDSNSYNKFYYRNNLLDKYESVENGEIVLSISYSYDNEGRIEVEKVENNGSIKDSRLYKYFYNNNGLVDKVEFSLLDIGNYQLYGYFILYYNDNNQLIRREFFSNNNTIREKNEYEYNSYGDCIKNSWYILYKEPDSLYQVRRYEYDLNSNPEYNVGQTFGKFLVTGKHNVTKSTTETFLSSYSKEETIYTYKYDKEGYPIKRKREGGRRKKRKRRRRKE